MTTKQNDNKKEVVESKKTCGIIMPLSSHPDYLPNHWQDVLEILNEAINMTEFVPKLVSDDDAIGLIHDRIVTNIYNNEIVVCDVSSKNPNVMFELGLRLAFDKPTIIIKDEITDYSFDTGVIEHIAYPKSLRFGQIVKFKEELSKRIVATYKKSEKDPNFSPFLKSFGKTISPASLQQTEISEGKFIIEQIEMLRKEIFHIGETQRLSYRNFNSNNPKRGIKGIFYGGDKLYNGGELKRLYETITEILRDIDRGHDDLAVFDSRAIFSIVKKELKLRNIIISDDELIPIYNTYLAAEDKIK